MSDWKGELDDAIDKMTEKRWVELSLKILRSKKMLFLDLKILPRTRIKSDWIENMHFKCKMHLRSSDLSIQSNAFCTIYWKNFFKNETQKMNDWFLLKNELFKCILKSNFRFRSVQKTGHSADDLNLGGNLLS